MADVKPQGSSHFLVYQFKVLGNVSFIYIQTRKAYSCRTLSQLLVYMCYIISRLVGFIIKIVHSSVGVSVFQKGIEHEKSIVVFK